MTPSPDRPSPLDAALDEQSLDWSDAALGPVERYLAARPGLAGDREATLDLIYHEVLLRRRRGEAPRLDEYLARFPGLAGPLGVLFEVHEGVESGEVSADDSPARCDGPAAASIPGFVVEAVLGRGGMGVVYRARHLRLNRTVALKMVLAGDHAGPERLARLRGEAEAVARLQHPNIVQVFEVGEHQGRPVVVLEYVEGSSLASALGGVPRPAGEAARLVATLAGAVDHAHRRGVVHRDLKPSNVLLTREGRPKVVDFGLAKLLDGDSERTDSGSLLGTPQYMAPEQAAPGPRRSGPAVDIYALGAILYEMLTGRPPFRAETPLDTLQQVVASEPVPPSRLVRRVPRDLETVCLKCLEKDPARRYGSADELAEDLGRFLGGLPVRARRVGPAGRAGRWCRRNPMPAALAGLLAGAVATAAVVSAVATVRLRAGRDEALRNLGRAVEAEAEAVRARREADEALWRVSLDRARAGRFGRTPGRRADGLAALARAAAIRPTAELRDEAIACMALDDLQPGRTWDGFPPGTTLLAFDGRLARYARGDDAGRVTVRDVVDDRECFAPPPFDGPVTSLVLSPDGRRLAAVGPVDGPERARTRAWEVDSGRPALDAPGGDTVARGFSPDGRRLAVGLDDGTILVHELAGPGTPGPAPPRRLRGGPRPRGLAFDPAGRRIAVALEAAVVEVHDLDAVAPAAPARRTGVGRNAALAWHPRGSVLAAVPGGPWAESFHIALLDLAAPGKAPALLRGHRGPVVHLAFNRAGDRLASIGFDGFVRLWDYGSGEQILAHPTDSGPFLPLRFSDDDARLAFGRDGARVEIWDVGRGRVLREIGDYADRVDFSDDGRRMAWATDRVVVWDLDAWRPAWSSAPGFRGHSVAFLPGGRGLLTTGDTAVLRWAIDPAPGPPGSVRLALARDFGFGPARGVAVGPGGVRVAVAFPNDGRALLFDPDRPEDRVEFRGHHLASRVAVSPDARWVATGSFHAETVKVWDARSGRLAVDLAAPSALVEFSPDGRWLATGSGRETRLWEAGTWRPGPVVPALNPTSMPRPVAFSPDGRALALTRDHRTIGLVDPDTGRPLATLESPNTWTIQGLRFSPDGRRLAVSRWGDSIQVWELDLIGERLAGMGLSWDLPRGKATRPHPGSRRAPPEGKTSP